MFQPELAGTSETRKLIDFYCGNPLALTVVSRSINSMFDGDIQEFLDQDANVFGDIRYLLDQQYGRLSEREQQVMYWLAIEREPISTDNLRQDIVPMISKSQILESVISLRWRSLIEKNANSFTQQPVVMEYMTDRLIDMAYNAAIERSPEFLMSYARPTSRRRLHSRNPDSSYFATTYQSPLGLLWHCRYFAARIA